MKSAIALIVMVVSLNSYAHFYFGPVQMTTLAPTLFSVGTSEFSKSENRKAAEILVRDANDYRQDGTLSIKLAQQIDDVQKSIEASDEEAVDLLIDIAGEILK